MYDVLQVRNPESVGIIQLEYRQYREDFEKANSVKVNIYTGQLLFDFPQYGPSHTKQIVDAKQRAYDLEMAIAAILGGAE